MYFINLPQLSDLLVIVLTISGEGIGEPWEGKVGIADSIYNYAQDHHLTIRQSCLARKPDRYSCWGNPDKLIAKTASFETTTSAWRDCMVIARWLNDGAYKPASTATHYLNPKLVKRMPAWTKKMRLIGDVGNHRFYAETK
jgi:hypothetical protein